MSIQRLPNDVIDKIISSSSIVSLNGVICGLVKNSLDAGASKVSIVLDYVRGNCTVEDNGEGIPPKEFTIDGGLAKANSTSRFPHYSSYHGHQGNFLASLAALSLVIISSKIEEEDLHRSIAVHHGAAASRDTADPSVQHRISFSHGTRVAVFDLFGSMPVRVKHRASVFSTPPYLEKEFKSLTYDLTALLLAWPSSVSISLREAMQNCQLRMNSLDGLATDRQTSRLLTQTGLSDSDESNSWIPVAAVNGSISVDGCISTVPAATRNSQFISLGIHPIEKSLGGNILFEEMNEIFTSSSFGVIEDAGREEKSTGSDLPSYWKPRKGPERWPMFYLRFKSEDVLTDNLLRPQSSTLAAIIALLRAVCYAFLRKHKMRPRKRVHTRKLPSPFRGDARLSPFQDGQSTDNGSPSPGKSSLSLFDNWRRIKVGHHADMASAQPKIVGSGGQLLREPFATEESFAGGLCGGADNHHLQSNELRTFETLDTHCLKGKGQWLEKIIQSWENPVFDTVEPAVHQLPADSNTQHTASTNISGQISKNSLAEAEVIAQVDNKFVLVKLPLGRVTPTTDPAQSALVAVDQHAADERCRLEELMAGYFERRRGDIMPVVEPLDQHLSFEISQKEAKMFAKRMAFWLGWGIKYQVADTGGEPPAARATVTGLPPSILERCRGEPRLLLDLLRREIWSAEDNPGRRYTKIQPSANFQGCPRGILELLHSRACRSAIMFNDELTLAECTSLIRRLAQCSLPFQCAHGRPSMAPLVDLGNKTDGVLCTLPAAAFRDGSSVPVLPSLDAWSRWMDG